MNDPATMHTGPLGSTIHVLRADAETVEALAAVDWTRHFRRVWLDPVLGLIALMAPSYEHEDLTELVDRIVDAAGSTVADAVKGLRHLRLRGRGEPPGTGMEADGAYYIGARARALLRRPSGRRSGGGGVRRADRARSRGRDRDHELRRRQDRALRRPRGAGAVAVARPQGDRRAAGGPARAPCRAPAAPARRLAGGRRS